MSKETKPKAPKTVPAPEQGVPGMPSANEAQIASAILGFLQQVEIKGHQAETLFACQQYLRDKLPKA